MNRRVRILAVLGLVIISTLYYMRNAHKPAPPKPSVAPSASAKPSFQMNQVLVAKANLNPVESPNVTGDKVEVRTDFPADMIPKDSAKTFTDIEGLILTAPIYQGEIVSKSRFLSPFDIRSKKLGDFLKKGYRAMTVEVDEVNGGAGFIAQGDHIDIVASYIVPGSTRQITRIIVQNVIVLAKGPSFATKPQRVPPGAIHGGTGAVRLTLLVEPRMAERMTHIIDQRGQNHFRFILRNPEDKTEAATPGVLFTEIITGLPRSQARKTESLQAPVEIMRGQARTNEYSVEFANGIGGGGAQEAGGGARGGASTPGAGATGGAQTGVDNMLGMQ